MVPEQSGQMRWLTEAPNVLQAERQIEYYTFLANTWPISVHVNDLQVNYTGRDDEFMCCSLIILAKMNFESEKHAKTLRWLDISPSFSMLDV